MELGPCDHQLDVQTRLGWTANTTNWTCAPVYSISTSSFPYFLPSPFLMCCVIIPTSFGERDLIWGDDWSQSPFIRRSPSWGILVFSLSSKANARRPVHSPQDHSIMTLIISNRHDWRDTRGKWPLARNPDRSW
jgi:hypothetical protein